MIHTLLASADTVIATVCLMSLLFHSHQYTKTGIAIVGLVGAATAASAAVLFGVL